MACKRINKELLENEREGFPPGVLQAGPVSDNLFVWSATITPNVGCGGLVYHTIRLVCNLAD